MSDCRDRDSERRRYRCRGGQYGHLEWRRPDNYRDLPAESGQRTTRQGYATGFLQFLDDNQTLFPEMAVTVQLHKNSEERRSEPVWIVVAWELSTLGDVPGSAASGTAKVDHERGHADALYSGALARPARLRGTLLGCPITKRPLNSDGHGDHTLPHGMGRRTSTREIIWRIGTSSFSGPYPCNAVTGLT